MEEQKNINHNTSGEKPSENHMIIQVRNISNAEEVLTNFKNAVLRFLENSDLDYKNLKWEKILPKGIVNKIKQLDGDDFKYDELLYNIDLSIDDFKESKKWKWYSSFLIEKGFDIIVTGNFNVRFINFIHCQNVPLKDISIVDINKNEVYQLKTIKDYTTYKILK